VKACSRAGDGERVLGLLHRGELLLTS
jgi:hypothetical protein